MFQVYNSHRCLDDLGVFAHPHVVIATPDSHSSTLIVGHSRVRVVVGMGELSGLPCHHSEHPIRVVLSFGLNLVSKEHLVVQFAISCAQEERRWCYYYVSYNQNFSPNFNYFYDTMFFTFVCAHAHQLVTTFTISCFFRGFQKFI